MTDEVETKPSAAATSQPPPSVAVSADGAPQAAGPESGPASAVGPDLSRVNAHDWPQRAFPLSDRRPDSVCVVIKQSVLDEIHRHGQSRTDVEICGVLVGSGYRDERGPFVYVENLIRGQHSDSQTAQVTFTGETWNHIHNELDRRHPDLRILGWYHTHPGFGVFLSPMDLFIHENYFNADEQMALVYDPRSGDEGLFLWRSGVATRDGFLVENDITQATSPVSAANNAEFSEDACTVPGDSSVVEPATAARDELLARIARIERRQAIGALGLVGLAVLILVSPAITWLLVIEPNVRRGESSIPALERQEPKAANDPKEPSGVEMPSLTKEEEDVVAPARELPAAAMEPTSGNHSQPKSSGVGYRSDSPEPPDKSAASEHRPTLPMEYPELRRPSRPERADRQLGD